MRWTKKLPTKEAYYWFRGSEQEPSTEWCVFHCFINDKGVMVIHVEERPITELMESWSYGQWSDRPIPEPEEEGA